MRKPTHPGIILKQMFLTPHRITQTALAEALGVSRKHVSAIIHAHGRITPALAVRLAAVLGTSAEFWLNLQNKTDIYSVQTELGSWRAKALLTPAIS